MDIWVGYRLPCLLLFNGYCEEGLTSNSLSPKVQVSICHGSSWHWVPIKDMHR